MINSIADKKTKQTILHRLKISRGHLDKVIEMVESGEYCMDVVHQSLAIQAALKKVDLLLLENHLKYCVSEPANRGDLKKIVNEMIKVINSK